jgi:adenylate cyclase
MASLSFHRNWLSFFVAIFAVAVSGVLFWASPLGQRLERDFGLELAFRLRGDRAPPAEAVYVPISHASARVLGQGTIYDLDEWDRSLFAELIDRLAGSGVSVIVFDILFARAAVPTDERLAAAMRRAGNVVLLSWVEQARRAAAAEGGILLDIDQLHQPAELFASAAGAVAPMLLRKDIRMDRFDTFPRVAGRMAPAIPTVALYLYQRRQLADALARCPGRTSAPDPVAAERPRRIGDEIQVLRMALLADPATRRSPGPDAGCAALRASALGRALTLASERYLNFYGGPGTLEGPGFHDLLGPDGDALAQLLRGKVVFVGIADNAAVNPPDSFDTALGGSGISGVELVSTAFANLLHGDDLKRVTPLPGAALLLLFGALLAVSFLLLPRRQALLAVLACGALYAGAAWHLFGREHLWLPVIAPLFVQMPLTIALGWRFRLLEIEKLTDTLKKFLSRWLREKISRRETISTEAELLYGVCMHTDVAGYSDLCERLGADPLRLKTLEQEYWSLVDEQIAAHQGERLEISGDGMTCIWTAPSPDKAPAARALHAALGLQQAIDRFNARHADTPFRTRIGLHAGRVALGLIGGGAQYTLAVGGDVATTAARLESDINKLLKTRVLASGAVLAGVESVAARKVGTFVPRGKRSAVEVYELCEPTGAATIDAAGFAAALAAFEAGDWDGARRHFAALRRASPDDGPTGFYAELLDAYLAGTTRPPSDRPAGVIDLNSGSLRLAGGA